ncbi:hypothetical protein ACFV9C_15285 [Kribbella sp. NPDC059898]|uniref:hypothetical protein n=1 Tax=Kribbella sp. NPDC059898 TaxID=3346995 RepID=UPI0036572670
MSERVVRQVEALQPEAVVDERGCGNVAPQLAAPRGAEQRREEPVQVAGGGDHLARGAVERRVHQRPVDQPAVDLGVPAGVRGRQTGTIVVLKLTGSPRCATRMRVAAHRARQG